MTTPVIIDIVVAAGLGIFALFGAKRGLFRALTGLVIFLAALVGAGLIASALAQPAAKVVTPLFAERITQQIDEAIADRGPVIPDAAPDGEQDGNFAITDLLTLLGIDEDLRLSLTERAEEKVREAGVSAATAVVESVAESILYAVLYIFSFALLTLALTLAARALDLVLKLPGLHLLNSLGGAAVGLIEGAVLLFLGIWLLRRFGVSFETEAVAGTHLLRFFTTNTPLSALSFLH